MTNDVLSSTEIQATLDRLKATGRLPSPKGVALEIIRLARDESASSAQIARIIQGDPALAARLIQAANSASRGVRRPIIAINEAVTVLGLPLVRQLALGFSVLSENREGASKRFDYQDFWSRSLLRAVALQALALRTGMAAPEETFVCGLLSRIGDLALASVHPQEYDSILSEAENLPKADLRRMQRERLGVDYAQLTVMLLLDWNFPHIAAQATLAAEDTNAKMPDEGSRAYLFARAAQLATKLTAVALGDGAERRKLFPALLLSAARLGIDAEDLQGVLDGVTPQWMEWAKRLDAPVAEIIPLSQSFDAVEEKPAKPASSKLAIVKAQYPLRILAVDDDSAILAILKRLLTAAGHTVYTASDGAEGLERALEISPNLVITDWQMPTMDGLQFCRALRATKIGRGIHVLILTGFENEERLVEAFEAGADDYVNKPFSPRALSARINGAQRVLQLQDELRRDAEEMRRIASELAVNNRRLEQAAMTDPLTDLPNRRYALNRLEQERAATKRRNTQLSCILIDIDHFKSVNDRLGHEAGDSVLCHVAGCLRQGARLADAVTRLGGDELLVICPDTGGAEAYKCAERLRALVSATPFEYAGQRVGITISVGVATFGGKMQHVSDLLLAADRALYEAKDGGRNRVASVKG